MYKIHETKVPTTFNIIEARLTIFLVKRVMKKVINPIINSAKFVVPIDPTVVATPFPPLNFKNIL